MIFSMTGFASTQGTLPDGRGFCLTVKSVNHRHMDLQLRLANGMDALEPALRKAVKEAVRRGHVEVLLTLTKASASVAAEIDEVLLTAHVRQFRELAARLGLDQEPSLSDLLRLPGVTGAVAQMSTEAGALEPVVLAAFAELLEKFDVARRAEGEALGVELRAALSRLANFAREAKELRNGIVEAEFIRLRARMTELLQLAENDSSFDEGRLLTEAGMLAARGDVEEELVRLETHVARFGELLDTGGEVGRPLDFLLQELNRETNTLLSKTSGSEAGLRLTEIGLAIKVELERAREQVQNLE